MTVRRTVCRKIDCLDAPCARRAGVEKTVETPTRNRKVGKTRSVGVKPFHAACFIAQYAFWPSPLLLTMIMKPMVSPRKHIERNHPRGFY